jgi:2-oxoglutarate dehydrogenase E1 component
MSKAPEPVGSSVNGWNAAYLDAQYEAWKADPTSVAPDVAQFLMGFELASARGFGGGAAATAGMPGPMGSGGPTKAGPDAGHMVAEHDLIDAYRELGHMCAAIDPFDREREMPAELTPGFWGLTESDLEDRYPAPTIAPDGGALPLREIIAEFDKTYCGSMGIEVGHMTSRTERNWFYDRIEPTRNNPGLSRGERAHVLYLLHRAELFEKFCGKRYPGVKRFSLEGGESLIPLLDRVVERAGDEYQVEEIVFAMSHRGRLNVLVNVMGKMYEQVFTEFDDSWEEDAEEGGGDVKYHRGYSSNRVLPSGRHVWLAMASNPSHLEAVAPVALGRCRAKQRLKGDSARKRVIPLIMHGDAAVIGQGVVAEAFNLAYLDGYTVGGTVHVVVNNLIGFTTGQEDARSSRYATDMAKMIEAPVLHVNGEDPEAVVQAAQLALDFRMTFNKDIVIDLLCYRRHGHNETDEAMFTQPLLYKEIKSKPSVTTSYAKRLKDEGVIGADDVEQIRTDLEEDMDRAYLAARKTPVDPTPDPGHRQWEGLTGGWSFKPTPTGVPTDDVEAIAKAISSWPEDFEPHRKLIKTLKQRTDAVVNGEPFDWATAEALAIGSLLLEGFIVRFSGQDSCRGTFSQRHAVLRDVRTAARYVPLNHIREMGVPGTQQEAGTINSQGEIRQGKFCIYDSPLSEYAVMGFEYGFSLASPRILAIWEAQFGDFSNGGQVIIDQFLASAELKWQRWSAMTLLLPHGYEGQGPEHSSARLERFLKLCGQDNMQVCYPSTPAQYFHMLRRQMHRQFRKPLVVMTPKSLLRLPACRSTTDEVTRGGFQEVIDDVLFERDAAKRKKVSRVLLCSGKVYYDLIERREQSGRDDVAIVRVEQLYPLHVEALERVRKAYPANAELVWVQEEPKNMGAAGHMFIALKDALGWDIGYAGRPYSGTPATGSPKMHAHQLNEFLTEAIGPVSPDGGGKEKDTTRATSKKTARKKASGKGKAVA